MRVENIYILGDEEMMFVSKYIGILYIIEYLDCTLSKNFPSIFQIKEGKVCNINAFVTCSYFIILHNNVHIT